MKILHLISSLDPASGGAAEGVRQLTSAVSELGVNAAIVTLDAADAPWLNLSARQVIALGPTRGGAFAYSGRLIPWLKEHVSEYDAVIVDGLWQFHDVAAWWVLRGSAVPYFVFPHGMLDPWFKRTYPLKHLKKLLFWWVAQHRVLGRAAGVFFTCEEERRLARESFWPYRVKECVVNFGTSIPAEARTASREVFLRAFPQVSGKRIILFLGRFHEKKACDLVVQAFAEVAERHPDLHLVMAGPDNDGWQDRLTPLLSAKGLADRATWTGMLQAELKWGAFMAAEAFLLPSHQENFGVAVAEALAVGTPVLISDKVNIWREIEADGAGLVAPDTLEGTISLLERWLSLSAERRRHTAGQAKICFETRFDIQRAALNVVTQIRKHLDGETRSTIEAAPSMRSPLP